VTPEESLEESIKDNIERVEGLKEGLNFFNGSCFLYEICDGSGTVNKEHPARGQDVPCFDPILNLRGQVLIYHVGVWKGVPDDYKPILVIHELREYDTESHQKALEYELQFAHKFLGEKDYPKFVEWRKRYDVDKN
jgi:hypothetical protein